MEWTVEPVSVHGPEARSELLAYYGEIVGSYHGRPATDAEVASTMADAEGPGRGQGAVRAARLP